jgi:hypothetical protein
MYYFMYMFSALGLPPVKPSGAFHVDSSVLLLI